MEKKDAINTKIHIGLQKLTTKKSMDLNDEEDEEEEEKKDGIKIKYFI